MPRAVPTRRPGRGAVAESKQMKRLAMSVALLAAVGLCAPAALAQRGASASPGLLQAVQDDIAAAESRRGAGDAYRSKQRGFEVFWWYKIAGWLVEDAVERAYLRGAPAQRLLDLGCGHGTLLAVAATIEGAPGVCMDVADALYPEIRDKYRLTLVLGDIERGPLPQPAGFDVVLMTEVIEHLNFHPRGTLRKINEAMAAGGSFFLSTPDAASGYGRNYRHYKRLDDIPDLDRSARWIDDHIWHYDEAELRGVLARAGFAVRRLERTTTPWGEPREAHLNVWAIKR